MLSLQTYHVYSTLKRRGIQRGIHMVWCVCRDIPESQFIIVRRIVRIMSGRIQRTRDHEYCWQLLKYGMMHTSKIAVFHFCLSTSTIS